MDILFRINEFIMLLYFTGLSVLAYDLALRNRQARKVSFYVIILATALHLLTYLNAVFSLARIPMLTTYEGMFTLSLVLSIVGIMYYYKNDSEQVLFGFIFLSFIFFSMFTFQPEPLTQQVEVSVIMNELLIIHVGLALLAYVLFFVSALHSLIYVIQYTNLKKKRFNRTFFSLFSIEMARKMMMRTVGIGLMTMTISIFLGYHWGLQIIGPEIIIDIKVLGTSFIVVLYIMLLFYLKKMRNLYVFAILNMVLFIICMINYLFVSQFSNFHIWT